jgi:hypothetical protein
MAKQLQIGDRVSWHSSGGSTEGTIKEIITESTNFKDHHFKASKDSPQYLVESEKSGKTAIHKDDALEKI